jgi:sugar lactone lactonase YvrE
MNNPDGLYKIASVSASLGESPVWDANKSLLYFIDITAGKINRLLSQGVVETIYQSTRSVGALALTNKGNLIFTEDASVALFNVERGEKDRNTEPVYTATGYRFNDGACDPQGRFITGLMSSDPQLKSGALYRYNTTLKSQLIHQNVALPNGLAWSEDGRTLFFVDSVACSIFQANYSPDGEMGTVTLFARTPAELGRPDGIALDTAGGLWVCQFNGACLLYYNSHGELSANIPMPVPRPTSCCFGGKGLGTLFITSARFAMTPSELARYPDAGDLYALRPRIAGIPRHLFRE